MLGEAVLVEYAFAVWAVGQLASKLTQLTNVLGFAEFHGFEEIFGVIWFSGFCDVFLDCHVKNGNQKMQI